MLPLGCRHAAVCVCVCGWVCVCVRSEDDLLISQLKETSADRLVAMRFCFLVTEKTCVVLHSELSD